MVAPITTEFIEVAKDLIDDFIPETNAVWCSVQETVDPTKPYEQPKRLITKRDVKIFFFTQYSSEAWQQYFPDTEFQTGRVQGIMYKYDTFVANKVDFVEFNDEELTIKQLDPMQPIDDIICYFMEFGT